MKAILRQAVRWLLRFPRALANRRKRAAILRQRNLRVHLGCGGDRQADFLNIDSRPTAATDATMDLNQPPFSPASVSFAYSNAFFEHLYRDSRLPHLRAVCGALQDDGACCYIGIPYFRNIAKFYVERAPGTAGPVFDLYNVYRYTHGDPEQAKGWWLGQLHKSLFDEDELSALLRSAGFGAFVLFCYAYPGDAHELPVNLGFYATKSTRGREALREECRTFLARFADQRIRMSTLAWLDG